MQQRKSSSFSFDFSERRLLLILCETKNVRVGRIGFRGFVFRQLQIEAVKGLDVDFNVRDWFHSHIVSKLDSKLSKQTGNETWGVRGTEPKMQRHDNVRKKLLSTVA